MTVSLTSNNGIETPYYVTFLPTSDVVPSSDFDTINKTLEQTISLVHAATNGTINFWKLVNWVWVSYYWVFLYNFGAIAPMTYKFLNRPLGTEFIGFGYPDFTQPSPYNSINNIFLNETLFEIYSDYLNSTLVPVYNSLMKSNVSLPPFLPINGSNRLQPLPVSLKTTYSCTERQLRGWVSVAIGILVADYAFITGAFTLFIWIGKWKGFGTFAVRDRRKGKASVTSKAKDSKLLRRMQNGLPNVKWHNE